VTRINREELAETPFTDQEKSRIRLGIQNYSYFLEHIYPAGFPDETYYMADKTWQPFQIYALHQDWAAYIGYNVRVCIIAPRAHLKSTVVGRGFSFWQLFRGTQGDMRDIDGVYFSYKDNLAREHTEAIKSLILDNPYCRFWKDRKPTSDSLVDFTCSFDRVHKWHGVVDPAGILGAARGRHPKFVIADDILSDFSKPLEAPEILRITRVFRQVVMSMPQIYEPLILIGTPQAENDILHLLKDDKRWHWARYPAEKPDGSTQWPEKFDITRLHQIKAEIKDMAYGVEYMLKPVVMTDMKFQFDIVRACVKPEAKRYSLDEPFENPENIEIYGGMDVGKEAHPSHISVMAKHPETGTLVQIYDVWLDHIPYNQQAKLINRIMKHFNVWKFLYDSTRAELDDRRLNKKCRGIKFSKPIKAHMINLLEARFCADPDEPTIWLLGPTDSRQVRQICSIRKDLSAYETEDGHGDAAWSNALCVLAAEQGPTFTDMGDIGEIFGGLR